MAAAIASARCVGGCSSCWGQHNSSSCCRTAPDTTDAQELLKQQLRNSCTAAPDTTAAQQLLMQQLCSCSAACQFVPSLYHQQVCTWIPECLLLDEGLRVPLGWVCMVQVDTLLSVLLEHSPQLTRLDLAGNSCLPSRCLQWALRVAHPRLRVLSLQGCQQVSSA